MEPGRESPIPVEPELQLVSDAETIITTANAHIVQTCLNWYKHWCAAGNIAAAKTAADILREEIVKAGKMTHSSGKKD